MRNVLGNCGSCGLLAICETESLPDTQSPEIVYYDDEELDVFKTHASDAYSEQEIAQFSEILDTLQASDIAGWMHSLQMRGIALPDVLKGEKPLNCISIPVL
ncbi:MAG: hypothetical protein LBU22_12005 [Dysgonamonadaceae bacterium]|jgi:hypothetical protein|nr:hypothetical protein [Dysgonamonadaceae bacterium]